MGSKGHVPAKSADRTFQFALLGSLGVFLAILVGGMYLASRSLHPAGARSEASALQADREARAAAAASAAKAEAVLVTRRTAEVRAFLTWVASAKDGLSNPKQTFSNHECITEAGAAKRHDVFMVGATLFLESAALRNQAFEVIHGRSGN